MRWMLCLLISWLALARHASVADTVSGRLADGFSIPVGIDNGKRYYKARGFRPNGHLGEDWNGVGGGNTDLGDPVHATAHGIVVYAKNFRAGWGNVVIIRHAYSERGDIRFVDSLYGHLHAIHVREGARVSRGDRVGTIGTGNGRYPAHLHFEIRKDIRVGMFRSKFPRDFRAYFDPTQFIVTHQQCPGGSADIPMNTFPNESNYESAAKIVASQQTRGDRPTPVTSGGKRIVFSGSPRWSADTRAVTQESPSPSRSSKKKRGSFKVDRFGDLRGESR